MHLSLACRRSLSRSCVDYYILSTRGSSHPARNRSAASQNHLASRVVEKQEKNPTTTKNFGELFLSQPKRLDNRFSRYSRLLLPHFIITYCSRHLFTDHWPGAAYSINYPTRPDDKTAPDYISDLARGATHISCTSFFFVYCSTVPRRLSVIISPSEYRAEDSTLPLLNLQKDRSHAEPFGRLTMIINIHLTYIIATNVNRGRRRHRSNLRHLFP